MGDEGFFVRIAQARRVVDHQGAGRRRVFQHVGHVDVFHVKRRVLAHQDHIQVCQRQVHLPMKLVPLGGIVRHRQPARAGPRRVAIQVNVAHFHVEQLPAPPLGREQQSQGRVFFDIDPRYGIHDYACFHRGELPGPKPGSACDTIKPSSSPRKRKAGQTAGARHANDMPHTPPPSTLRIVSRKSQLALRQAGFVRSALQGRHPGLAVEIIGVTTAADRFSRQPLPALGGKGAFVKELEQALLQGAADLAVHSVKDVSGAVARRPVHADAHAAGRPSGCVGVQRLRGPNRVASRRADRHLQPAAAMSTQGWLSGIAPAGAPRQCGEQA